MSRRMIATGAAVVLVFQLAAQYADAARGGGSSSSSSRTGSTASANWQSRQDASNQNVDTRQTEATRRSEDYSDAYESRDGYYAPPPRYGGYYDDDYYDDDDDDGAAGAGFVVGAVVGAAIVSSSQPATTTAAPAPAPAPTTTVIYTSPPLLPRHHHRTLPCPASRHRDRQWRHLLSVRADLLYAGLQQYRADLYAGPAAGVTGGDHRR